MFIQITQINLSRPLQEIPDLTILFIYSISSSEVKLTTGNSLAKQVSGLRLSIAKVRQRIACVSAPIR